MSEEESYLIKPPDPAEIVRSRDSAALSQFLKDPRSAIAGALIEGFSHGPSAFGGSLVRVAVAALTGRALEQFATEIKDFQNKGKIAEDWADKGKGYQTWVELLRVIDEENPDEERLEALKAMFFAVNRVNADDGNRLLAYQLFQIAKQLNSNEVLVMKAAYELFQQGRVLATNQRGGWRGFVSERLGHSVDALVHLAEKALIERQLLYDTPISVENSVQGKLTQLGLKFCENIQQYRIDRKEQE